LIYTYALPALVHVQDRIATAGVAAGGDSGPFALILTDVKKQGDRIIEKLKAYGEPLGIKCHLVSGGHEKKTKNDPVEMGLKDNPHIVVACLGQTLADLLLSKKLNLKRCSFLVLDDGCRLIKNSILLKDILGQIRNDRQVVLWTNAFSTVGTETTVIKALYTFGFTDYLRLFFGSYAHFNNPNALKHVVLPVTEASRLSRFSYLVQNILTAAASTSPNKVKFLIFCNTPDKVSRILNLLLSIGLQARHFVKPKKNTADTATGNADAANTTAATDAGVDKVEETAEPAVDENAENSALTPRERNDQNMRENPTTYFWITYTTTPLDDTDYAAFDFMLNFDFPIDNLAHFGQRAAKFNAETGGKGTIYSLILDTDGPRVNKYLANFLQDACQVNLYKQTKKQCKQYFIIF
jgi:superfamily II DNA/RNA helicase